MVLSGLTGTNFVKPVKLAPYFVFALCLIGYAFWFWLGLAIPWRKLWSRRFEKNELAHFSHPFYSIDLWAMMAGENWRMCVTGPPSMGNGYLMLLFSKKWHGPFGKINNSAFHTSWAGLPLLLLVIIWTIMSYRPATNSYYIQKFRSLPLFNVALQVLLGIMTVILSTDIVPNHWVAFDWFALAHQMTGMLFVLSMVFMIYILQTNQGES
jgi:cytochrome c oxidase assembly protein subunit 15